VVKRTESEFMVLPRRWVVERTFGWLGRYRRLSKDYELLPEVSASKVRQLLKVTIFFSAAIQRDIPMLVNPCILICYTTHR